MKRHLLKSHVSIPDFALSKQVYPTSVYSAIAAGKIKPDLVGQSKIQMIDLRKYGRYKFQVRNSDKTALNNWYRSIGKAPAQQPHKSKKNEKAKKKNLHP